MHIIQPKESHNCIVKNMTLHKDGYISANSRCDKLK